MLSLAQGFLSLSLACCILHSFAMPMKKCSHAQITEAEQSLIEKVYQSGTATDALQAVNKARAAKSVPLLEKSSVHRFVKGKSHKRCAKETRGRKQLLTKMQLLRLDQA